MCRSRLLGILAFLFLFLPTRLGLAQEPPYRPTWESLSKHQQAPEWFSDAKFGIYFHWGVYTVPAFQDEWYPRSMHLPGHPVYQHHVEKYGDPSEFPYHRFVPEFKAEEFDAAAWADLFRASGARFAGPVAQHHDGFAMWASEVNPWNVRDKGPKKDITGLLAEELRERGLKLITTFHHARLLQRNADDQKNWAAYDSHFPYHPDWATSSKDPELAKLYGNLPADEFHKYWGDQVKEVIDKYSPDMIWFDSWLNYIPEKDRQELAAYYLNDAHRKGKAVAIGYKQADYPSSVGIFDIEQGGRKDVTDSVWMTDITITHGSWSYTEGQTVKDSALVIRNMIDVWSKNGVVLLNVSPKSDGTIPDSQQKVLRDIGRWLELHGEAVYGTHPHTIYGYGTAVAQRNGHGGQSATTRYTAGDIRLTISKDNRSMFVFFLGKPAAGKTIRLGPLGKHMYCPPTPVKEVTVVGSGQPVRWHTDVSELFVTIPEEGLNEIATVLKLELE